MGDSNSIAHGREKPHNMARPRRLSKIIHNLGLVVIFVGFVVGCLITGVLSSGLIIPDIRGCPRFLTGLWLWFCWPLATFCCALVPLILVLHRAKPRLLWTSVVIALLVILTVYLFHFLLNTWECPGLWRGVWSG